MIHGRDHAEPTNYPPMRNRGGLDAPREALQVFVPGPDFVVGLQSIVG